MSVSRETATLLAQIGVSRETAERLSLFVDLLHRWSGRINLISKADLDFVWERHVLDSLQLLPLLPPGGMSAVDLGSGAGLPGLVLAVASTLHVNLVESDHRKAAFLLEAARLTDATVKVHCSRAEALSLPNNAVVMARGLAPLPKLLAMAHPFLAPTGICLFLKGGRAHQELLDASKAWTMKVERFTSRTDASGVVLRLSEVVRAQ